MVIGIDTRSMLGAPTGVGRYIANLLAQLSDLDKDNQYYLFMDQRQESGCRQYRFKHESIVLRRAAHTLTWHHCRLLPALLRQRVDLFHFPSYTIPLVRNYKTVVSIHDISYEVHPEWYPIKGVIGTALISKYAARNADLVLTCSHSTKRDIMRYYGVRDDRIRVIYYGVESRFRRIHDHDAHAYIKAAYGITAAKFILYVGSIHTRRNIDKLVLAFQRVQRAMPETQLVLVGKYEYVQKDVKALVNELRLDKYVIFTNYVREDDLPLLYSAADLFIFPSSYEGFGFPPLEAMACGTPVITSNNSSLSEVAGDAALLIDPLNVEEVADAMYQVLTNDALRDSLASQGLAQARKFSWEQTATQTLRVYQEVGGL